MAAPTTEIVATTTLAPRDSQPAKPRARGQRAARWWGGLAVCYLATAIGLSFPGILHLSDRVIGDGGDAPQTLWIIAWVEGWLHGAHGLYLTSQLLAPAVANLAWMTLALPAAIAAALLAPAVGLAASFNLVVLGALTANGLAAAYLARKLGLERSAAFLAGFVYLSSPYFVGQMLGHLHLLLGFGLPLFLAVLYEAMVQEKPRWRTYVGLGAWLVICTYSAEDYGLYAVAAAVAMVLLHPMLRSRLAVQWSRWGYWSLAALVFALAVAPLVYYLELAPLAVHNVGQQDISTPWLVDLLALVTPQPWGAFRALTPFWHLAPDLADGSGFPGYVLLAACVSLVWQRERVPARLRPLLPLALGGVAVFAVLSVGPLLHVNGATLAIPLPDALLRALPFWGYTEPERVALLTALFGGLAVGLLAETLSGALAAPTPRGRAVLLVVIAATALVPAAALLPRPGDDRMLLLIPLLVALLGLAGCWLSWVPSPGSLEGAVALALVLGTLLTSLPTPFPDTPLPDAPYVKEVQARGGAVFFVPAIIPMTADGEGGVAYMYIDALLGLPTPEGYLSRLPTSTSDAINKDALLGYLWGTQQAKNPNRRLATQATKELPSYLQRHGVRTIIVLEDQLADPKGTLRWLTTNLGTLPDWIHVYPGQTVIAVPARGAGGESSAPLPTDPNQTPGR